MSNKINLLSFHHDRKSHYKVIADETFNLINNFTDQEEFNELYNYFDKKYTLPRNVVKQTIRQHIARSYILKDCKFNSKLSLKNIPKSIFLYSALIYALFFSGFKKRTKKYSLIIDNITSALELKRFEKLLNLVGNYKVLCIIREESIKKTFPQYQFYKKRPFRNINLSDLFKSLFNEIFFGIWVVLKISIKTKVNLFPISFRIIHNYLSYKSLFDSNIANYIIQGKHYETEPIKNFMFKKLGGIASTSIQKNIIENAPLFFYMDLDILFSLGKDGYSRIYEYGGRVDKVYPVGSLFMEYQSFAKKQKLIKKYDIAILGINTSNAYSRLDFFDKFMDDYYSLYRWAAKLSLERPNYKIVVIHHASAGEDIIEDKILSGSNVKVLDKNYNSYEIAFSSKLAITYGSTMGYELNAHNLPTLFVDPGSRCAFLPEKGSDYIDNLRLDTYDKFKLIAEDIIDNKKIKNLEKNSSENFCLESSTVSNRINTYFEKIEK